MKRPASKQRKLEIEIEDGLKKEVFIYEIRPIDVKKAFDGLKPETEVFELITRLLPICSNLSVADIENFYPSDLENIWTEFKKLNSVFFLIQERLKIFKMVLDTILTQLQNSFLNQFAKQFPGSSETDTGTLGDTDGNSSQSPLTNSEKQR